MIPFTASDLARALFTVIEDAGRNGDTPAACYEEAHYQAGLWAWLRARNSDAYPIAEHAFSGKRWRERCDLCVVWSQKVIAWIEMKKAYLGACEGCQTKPAEQLRNLLWDVAKVTSETALSGAAGYVAVFFYNQRETPFGPELPAKSRVSPAECREALIQWYERSDNPSVEANVWEAFELPKRIPGEQLQPLYVRCVREIGDVSVESPSAYRSDFLYQVVASQL